MSKRPRRRTAKALTAAFERDTIASTSISAFREGRPCSAGSDTQRSAGNDRPSKLERGQQDEAQELAASVIGKGPHQVARLLDDSALLPHRPVTALLDDKRE